MLSIAERHKYILDKLNKYGFVRITDVANELGVTKVTIRKDVKILESKGLLYKVHGRFGRGAGLRGAALRLELGLCRYYRRSHRRYAGLPDDVGGACRRLRCRTGTELNSMFLF